MEGEHQRTRVCILIRGEVVILYSGFTGLREVDQWFRRTFVLVCR